MFALRRRWSSRVVGVAAAAVAVGATWPSSAGAHHPQAPVPTSPWSAVSSALLTVSIVLLVISVVVAVLSLARPRRWRSALSVRLVVSGLAASAVLAACSSTSESLGDAPDKTVLFDADGSDALGEAVREEAAQPGNGGGLPDLVGFIGSNYSTEEVEFAGQTLLVFNFDGIVGNVGEGPLDIYGNPQLADPNDPDSHEVFQREWTGSEWRNLEKLPIRFESADGHNHFHQMELARYTLHDPATLGTVAPSQKVGFCFLDSQPLGYWQLGKDIPGAAQLNEASPSPYAAFGRVDSYCRAGSPHAEALHMGISPGWGDLYAETLALQWVDISNVVPGQYTLSSHMDPNGVIAESDDTNNGPVFSEDTVTVSGHRALAVFASTTADTPVTVELVAETVGAGLEAPEFTITAGPEHGTIDVSLDTPGVGPTITYTPESGFSGVDTIEYSASIAGSSYPLVPTRSVVNIAVDADAAPMVISGYRPEVTVGTGVALRAEGPDGVADSAGLDWTVNGGAGDETVGTVVDGFYQSGTALGPVSIQATSPDGAVAEVSFEVVEEPNHAPFVGAPVTYQGDGDVVSSDPQSPARELTTFKAGEPLALLVPVVDLDGDPLVVTASDLPEGLRIGASTGAITGTPTQAGTYTVAVTASDGVDETDATIVVEIDD